MSSVSRRQSSADRSPALSRGLILPSNLADERPSTEDGLLFHSFFLIRTLQERKQQTGQFCGVSFPNTGGASVSTCTLGMSGASPLCRPIPRLCRHRFPSGAKDRKLNTDYMPMYAALNETSATLRLAPSPTKPNPGLLGPRLRSLRISVGRLPLPTTRGSCVGGPASRTPPNASTPAI